MAEPSRDSAHLLALLRERLGQLQLPAPTLDLRLHADDIARRAAPNGELYPTPQIEHDGLTRLVERLQANLGAAQIMRLEAGDDHRPERASRVREARAGAYPPRASAAAVASRRYASNAVRPVWLMEPPEPLAEREGGPSLAGQTLQLLSGPERIEAGWWHADLIERDYFIAQSPRGALVWIYRARLPLAESNAGWFLQGRFG